MPYAVVINLDYTSYPAEECAEMWAHVQAAMLEAGFRRHGRDFITDLPEEQALERARAAIESIEPHQDYLTKRIYRYIREFYAYSMDNVVNLAGSWGRTSATC